MTELSKVEASQAFDGLMLGDGGLSYPKGRYKTVQFQIRQSGTHHMDNLRMYPQAGSFILRRGRNADVARLIETVRCYSLPSFEYKLKTSCYRGLTWRN